MLTNLFWNRLSALRKDGIRSSCYFICHLLPSSPINLNVFVWLGHYLLTPKLLLSKWYLAECLQRWPSASSHQIWPTSVSATSSQLLSVLDPWFYYTVGRFHIKIYSEGTKEANASAFSPLLHLSCLSCGEVAAQLLISIIIWTTRGGGGDSWSHLISRSKLCMIRMLLKF